MVTEDEMPKLKPSEEEKQNLELLAKIDYYKRLAGATNPELARAAGFSTRNWYIREEDPSTFTFSELRGIARKLRTSVIDLIGGLNNG